ncbi:uncharacterized protein LOC62_04G006447 [Vanrija pseudolonga]|uniref:Uncharacterized protein n=1 Tax=Vanrija pseudolonga TaxID=143232 RepID=A0AAF0YA55_9TREE|nr:hypothetical protein LOC62_04G006447 [Vanrija pseudolonga]
MPPKLLKPPGDKAKTSLSDNETSQIYPPDNPPPPVKLPRVYGYSDARMRQLQEENHPVVAPLERAETLQFNEAWVKLFPKGVPVDDETLMGINHIDHQLLFNAFVSLLYKYPFFIRQGYDFFEVNVIAFKYNINVSQGFTLPYLKEFTFALHTERIRDLRVALPINHTNHGDIYRRFTCFLLQVLANPNLDTLFLDLEADFHFPYPMLDLYLSSPRSAGLHRFKIGVKDSFFAQKLIRGIPSANTDLQLICFNKCKATDAVACSCKARYLGPIDPGYHVLFSAVLDRNKEPRAENLHLPGCFVTLKYRREIAGDVAWEPAITKAEAVYILKNAGLINHLLKSNATRMLHERPEIGAQIIWDVLLRAPSRKQLAAQVWEGGTSMEAECSRR